MLFDTLGCLIDVISFCVVPVLNSSKFGILRDPIGGINCVALVPWSVICFDHLEAVLGSCACARAGVVGGLSFAQKKLISLGMKYGLISFIHNK